MHDCDILTYKREMLARLIYPVANPTFSYKFCKGYYSRIANNSMNGRVCRLLVTPLLRALSTSPAVALRSLWVMLLIAIDLFGLMALV